MRVFMFACIAAIAIAVIGALVLGSIQEPADRAFSTSAVRLGSSALFRLSDFEAVTRPDGDIAGRVVQIGARMGGAGADPTDSN
jgi:hypothetical protein